MSQKRQAVGALWAAILSVSIVVPATPAAADTPPPYVEHFRMFRSKATGNAANAEENARCEAHFADRPNGATIISRLDYHVHGIEVDSDTGLVTNDHVTDIGQNAFLCAVAPADTPAFPPYLEDSTGAISWSYLNLPGLPEIEVEGPCRIASTVNQGEAFFNCKFVVLPDATKGIIGGFASTNSVLNQGTPGYPTGSVWTAYIVTIGESHP